MSQQITINGHHLRHFHEISTLGIDPIELKTCCKIKDATNISNILNKLSKLKKINHECLIQSLTKKNGFFLNNFPYLGMMIRSISDKSNINNYQALRNQLISMYDDLLCKVITLHKQECNQIDLDPKHSSLKYLNLPSKRVMILKQKANTSSSIVCKVCSRGVELMRRRYMNQYGHNLCLHMMNQLNHVISLASISQQWILHKKKLILESINLENIDHDTYNFDNINSSSYQTYEQLLHDMNIIGQLKSFTCPFHSSHNFSPFEMIVNASNFYGNERLTNVSNNM